MVTERSASTVFGVMALIGLFSTALCLSLIGPAAVQAQSPAQLQSKGMAAIENAAENNRYLFIFFWKDTNEHARDMYSVFHSAMAKMAQSADSIGIQTTDPSEKPVVDKFGVDRAPMPLVVALAPNGAITKGFPVKFTEQQLQEAFVSRCTEQCMKALQDRKLVLLCVQNGTTQFNQVALRGVRDFKTDARFAEATEVVMLNPGDRTETTFLEGLQVSPRTDKAVTILLAPPGSPIARFEGPVTKEQLVAKVAAAKSGPCANGQCGPGGCGPKK